MKPEEVLSQISDGIWVNKGGLRVPKEVVQALSRREDWFDSIEPVLYSKKNIPEIKAIIEYFTEEELDNEVGYVSAEILQSCYGVNKVFNSKVHGDPRGVGEQKLQRVGQRRTNKETYIAAVEVNNVLINWKNLNRSGYSNNESAFERIKKTEEVNKNWFAKQIDDLKTRVIEAYDDLFSQFAEQQEPVPQEVRNKLIAMRNKANDNINKARSEFAEDRTNVGDIFQEIINKIKEELTKALERIKELILGKEESKTARAEARKENKEKRDIVRGLQRNIVNPVIRTIRKIFTKVKKLFTHQQQSNYKDNGIKSNFSSISSAYGTIAPVEIPNIINTIEVLKKITQSILTTFILKGIRLPGAFLEAIKNTVVSIILKRFNIPGGEAIRYITGGLLRTVKDLLPAVFNNTGMFAGAYGMLTACAPYILAAAMLVIIAIQLARRNQLGDLILILGLLDFQIEPDICFARVSGDEKMKDIQTLKEEFIEETSKDYDFIYALTFKSNQIARSLDISNETPVILPEEAALTIKEGISTLEYIDI